MTQDADDRFDTWVRDVSASYNAPPPSAEVPREEMWRQIAAERVAARQPQTWSRITRGPWSLAAAAVLLAHRRHRHRAHDAVRHDPQRCREDSLCRQRRLWHI